jgi:hypothetical protein
MCQNPIHIVHGSYGRINSQNNHRPTGIVMARAGLPTCTFNRAGADAQLHPDCGQTQPFTLAERTQIMHLLSCLQILSMGGGWQTVATLLLAATFYLPRLPRHFLWPCYNHWGHSLMLAAGLLTPFWPQSWQQLLAGIGGVMLPALSRSV